MRVEKRASETTDIVRQNENLHLKIMKKLYRIIRLFTHLRKFVPEIIPLWPKNWYQRFHTGGFMRGGAYLREAYTWSNTGVEEKVSLYGGGGGGLIAGEIRYEIKFYIFPSVLKSSYGF